MSLEREIRHALTTLPLRFIFGSYLSIYEKAINDIALLFHVICVIGAHALCVRSNGGQMLTVTGLVS